MLMIYTKWPTFLLLDVHHLCAFPSDTINRVEVSRDDRTARTLKVSTEEAVNKARVNYAMLLRNASVTKPSNNLQDG